MDAGHGRRGCVAGDQLQRARDRTGRQGAPNGQQAQTGFRFNADARTVTIDNLDPAKAYTFEVRSISQDGKSSAPFTVNAAERRWWHPDAGHRCPTDPTPAASADGTPVTASSVTATTAAGTQIWFAADTAVSPVAR